MRRFQCPLWLLLLHASGLETFVLPPWSLARGYLAVGAISMAFQVLLFAAIALTSPTFVAVGQLLVAPLSMAMDMLSLHYALPPPALLGTAAILAAILLVVYAPNADAAMRRAWRRARACVTGRAERKELLRARGERSDAARGDDPNPASPAAVVLGAE